ncbi:sensor histidine kinase [Halosegnis marinus]|uniref:histidine kinase n=1 Tax=Halosegnis marinus TaxID=3034023 RepID=A0ABD5ZJV0_9EURY|nr:HAMP domain-containing sensor histidine kinase [Halosegnis sp. DT85]
MAGRGRPPHKSLLSTTVENAVPLGLALVLVVTGVWLATRPWPARDALAVTKWTYAVSLGFGVVFAWVIGIQGFVQGDLKPLVIAMDAVLIGGLVAVAVGFYDVRRRRQRRETEHARARTSALFDNTDDDVATLRLASDGVETLATNAAFDANFDRAPAVLSRVIDAADTDSRAAFVRAVADGDPFEVEVELDDRGERREFIAQIVPYEADGDAAELFLVLTDVTEQKELARERVARSRIEHLHTVASEMANAPDADAAYDLTMSAAERVVPYDRACLSVDGETVRTRNADGPLDAAAADEAGGESRPLVETDGGAMVTDTDAGPVVTVPVGGRGVLQLGARPGALDESRTDAVELLATHLRETLRRLDREETIRHEREQMEFLNRVLRHDLLNGMNVVRMQGQLLESETDDEAVLERVDTVIDRVDSMTELINTMRSFMKTVLEGGEHELEPVALDDALTAAIESARDGHPGATFEVEGGVFPPVKVLADDLVSELFHNLLTNAVTHNDAAEPVVRVSAEPGPDAVEVVVADNGPGIPEGMRSRVLEKGEQGEASDGTGLGLYLCREIVDSYGGSLDIGESGMGGAAFTVRLPRQED